MLLLTTCAAYNQPCVANMSSCSTSMYAAHPCPWLHSRCAVCCAPQVEAIMKGFASIEKDGHAGELGSTGIRMGEDKYQVRRQFGPGARCGRVGGRWNSPAQQHCSRQAGRPPWESTGQMRECTLVWAPARMLQTSVQSQRHTWANRPVRPPLMAAGHSSGWLLSTALSTRCTGTTQQADQ
jgi:hypothetical protein